MPIAMNGYSLASNWATRKLTVVVGGYGSPLAPAVLAFSGPNPSTVW
jgi:hypothetical protein